MASCDCNGTGGAGTWCCANVIVFVRKTLPTATTKLDKRMGFVLVSLRTKRSRLADQMLNRRDVVGT
jgi:hypothetical protein